MAEKHLKSLEENNALAFKRAQFTPQPNGIACPNCGAELVDSDQMIMDSYPAQKNIHCTGCGYRGRRFC